LESEFKQSTLSGFYDLVLISGHAAQSGVEVDIDGVTLKLGRDLSDVRTEVVYFNACDVGSNRVLLEESFSALGAKYVVAPVSMVPWGKHDNEATRTFARCLLSGSSVEDALQACDRLWPGGNPYRVFSSAEARGRP
jgi:hypothetical protein